MMITANEAHNIAMNKYQIKISKQIKKALRGIRFRAKRGHFSIKYIDMYYETQEYLASLGYDIKTYIDMDNDTVTLIKWNKGENDA